jgi:hypothetical protein
MLSDGHLSQPSAGAQSDRISHSDHRDACFQKAVMNQTASNNHSFRRGPSVDLPPVIFSGMVRGLNDRSHRLGIPAKLNACSGGKPNGIPGTHQYKNPVNPVFDIFQILFKLPFLILCERMSFYGRVTRFSFLWQIRAFGGQVFPSADSSSAHGASSDSERPPAHHIFRVRGRLGKSGEYLMAAHSWPAFSFAPRIII